jgi:MoxR-like ATPase
VLQVQLSDLANGSGTRTGLPKPLVGGMELGTADMPVRAAGRASVPNAPVLLSYPTARGCVKLLGGELSSVELVGKAGDSDPSAIHIVLSNGSSHAWVGVEESPDGSKQLMFRGMPFSSQLVNYNFGLAAGLFAMLNRSTYPSFVSAVGKAVAEWTSQDDARKAETLALVADELAFTIEEMIEGRDPCGIQAVLMDRETPSGLDQVFDGGQQIKEAFSSVDAFQRLVGPPARPDVHAAQPDTQSEAFGFVGDLPDKLIDCIKRGKHVLLTGPTATGKTLAVEQVCQQLGAPLTVIRGSEGLEDRDLIGATVLEAASDGGGIATKTRFTYGPLPEAMMLGRTQYERYLQEVENAKREGREPVRIPPSVLLIDEINRLQLRFQNFLVSMLNVRKTTADYYLRIPDTNEEVVCPDGFLVIVAARNVGGVFAGTNPMDLALERRFYKKVQVEYLPSEHEATLVQSRTGLDADLTKVLVKVAADTRFQLAQLKAPIDTGTLLTWAEELAWLKLNGAEVTDQLVMDTAKDVVFGICLERSERGGFDPAGEAVLTDNISENWRDVFMG